MRAHRHTLHLVAAALLLVAPVLVQAKPFRDPAGGYSFEVPETWTVEIAADGGSAKDPGSGMARLMVVWGRRSFRDMDDFAKTGDEIFQSGSRDRTETLRQKTTVCGFEALHIQARRTESGLAIVEDIYLVLTPAHNLMLVMRSPQVTFARNQPVFQALVASLVIEGKRPQVQATPQPAAEPPPAGMKEVRDPKGLFSFPVPNDWLVAHQGDASYATDPQRVVNVGCMALPKQYPTVDAFAAALIGLWKRQVPDWTQVSRDGVNLGGWPGLAIGAKGTVNNIQSVGVYFMAVTDTHQFLLSFGCSLQSFQQYQAVFGKISKGCRLHVGGGTPGPGPAPPPPPQPRVATKKLQPRNRSFTVDVPAAWRGESGADFIEAEDADAGMFLEVWGREMEAADLVVRADGVMYSNELLWKGWRLLFEGKRKVCGISAFHIRARSKPGENEEIREDVIALSPPYEFHLILYGPPDKAGKISSTLEAIVKTWRIAGAEAPPEPAPTPPPTPAPTPAGMRQLADPNGQYTIHVPADWQAEQVPGVIAASGSGGRATLRCISSPREFQTLQQFAQAMAQMWPQQLAGWTQRSQQGLNVSGCPAILIDAVSRPNNVEIRGLYYLVLTNTHQLILALHCPMAEGNQHQAALTSIAASWRIGGGQAPPVPIPPPVAVAPPAPPTPPVPPVVPPVPSPVVPPVPPIAPPTPRPTPPNMKQVADQGGAFSVAVPLGWQVQQQPGSVLGADPTAQANLMVVAPPRTAQSLDQFVQTMVAGYKQGVPGWRQVSLRNTQVSGRPAVAIRATGTPGGQAAMADYVLVLTDRHQICLMLACPQQAFQQWGPIFQQIIQTFQAP